MKSFKNCFTYIYVFNILGLINVGDELREVNGIRVKGKSPLDILAILVCKNIDLNF